MRKNISYILTLICVIFISVFIHFYIINKREGYMQKSCPDINTLSNTMITDTTLRAIQNINTNGVDSTIQGLMNYTENTVGPALYQIIPFFINIDKFNMLITKNTNFFYDLFENPNLKDSDFLVLYGSYNALKFSLHNIRMAILNINVNINTQSNIPICRNIVIDDIKSWNNHFYTNCNAYVNTFKKVLDNINNTSNVLPNEKLFQGLVDQFTNNYNIILNLKQCSNGLFTSLTPENRNIIYPFLDLIRNYAGICINTLNKYFVPALNAKLKDGQKIIQEAPLPIPENKDGPTVSIGPLGDNSLVKVNNSLIQGVGATYS